MIQQYESSSTVGERLRSTAKRGGRLRSQIAGVLISAMLAVALPTATRAGGPGVGIDRSSGLPYQQAFEYWSSGGQAESELIQAIRNDLEHFAPEKVLARTAALHSRLADQNLESIAAVALLYVEALHQLSQSDPVMSVLPRMTDDALSHLETDLEQAPSAQAALGSYVATEFGRSALDARLWFSAERYFEKALSFDPRNAQALLGLGYFHELYGRQEEALRYYEQPGDESLAETRLRRAVTQIRVQRHDGALEELETLGREAEEKWIRSIAWQVLGRAWIERDDLQRAAIVLAEGLTALPDDHHIVVLRAFVADQLGESSTAETLVERSELPADASETDPRVRYSRPPRLIDDDARLTAAIDTDQLHASLQEALARIAP